MNTEEEQFISFLQSADNSQKTKFIKDYYEANGLKVDKIIRAKLDDGFYVYHQYGQESKAYKPHKIIQETENMKIVQTQPYKLTSDFITDEISEYTIDMMQIPVVEARNRAGVKSNFIPITDFFKKYKKINEKSSRGKFIKNNYWEAGGFVKCEHCGGGQSNAIIKAKLSKRTTEQLIQDAKVARGNKHDETNRMISALAMDIISTRVSGEEFEKLYEQIYEKETYN